VGKEDIMNSTAVQNNNSTAALQHVGLSSCKVELVIPLVCVLPSTPR